MSAAPYSEPFDLPHDPPHAAKVVLVADDDADVRDALANELRAAGFRVATARDGREALDCLEGTPKPDVVILDLLMPVMNGWEFRAAQRADPGVADVPVIAVSADHSPKAESVHADLYLRKPLDGRQLVASVERVLLDAERRQMQAQLARAEHYAHLGMLAASVAHEVNNPLSYVMANLSLISEDLPRLLQDGGPGYEDLEQRIRGISERLSSAIEGADRVRQVVRHLRHLSRADEEQRGPVDLRGVLDFCSSVAWNEIRHRARLVRHYDDVPAMTANEAQLTQVFLTLLLACVQALPEDTSASNVIAIEMHVDGRRALVEIRGEGVRDGGGDDLTMFAAPDGAPPSLDVRRLGLGLGLVRSVISAHGGEMVHSASDRSIIYRVLLPVTEAPSTRPANDRADSPVARREPVRARILVVDDEPAVGRALSGTLVPDYDVTVVSGAREALDRLAADAPFDLILSDLMMPGMSGMEFHEELLRRSPATAERVVFLTGGAFTPAAQHFLAHSGRDVLDKPFRVSELRAFVRKRLASTR